MRRRESLSTASRRSISARLDGLAMPLDRRRISRLDLGQQRSRLGGDQFLADAAGQQLGDEGVQPAALLVPPAGHVGVPFRQQPADRHVIGRAHHRQRRRVQRGQRHRAGVVRIGLGRLTGPQHPHPRGQRGGHIDHRLAGGHQLLGEQVAQPAGALHRPRPSPRTIGPRQQLGQLSAARPHGDLPEFTLPPVQHGRGV
jgi:hypothetical protein